MKILIADESQLVCARYIALLAELQEIEIVGFASTVYDTLSSIKSLQPSAVILDTRMGGGNGLDTLRLIKKLDSPPVVVVITYDPYPQYRKACLDAGADFLFDKATEFTSVSETLHKLNLSATVKESQKESQ